MRNLSWVVLGLLLCVPFAGAEVIDSVSFNPARLGRYETLKVSDQLTTKGGIEANAVTVQSGGTVSVNNAGNYKFPATEVLGSVEMTSTDFQADTLNSRGTASFENKSGSASSAIKTLNTNNAEVRANILELTGVSIPEGGSFVLGENAIPSPTQECNNLRWVERTADNNYKYKVLAFGSCAGGEGGEDCTVNPNQAKCCTDNQTWNGTKCVAKECPTPTHYPPACGSCYFYYNNIKINGYYCQGWNTKTCEWDDALATCTPNKNVWLKSYSLVNSSGCKTSSSGSGDKLYSRPTIGAECDSYGANFVKSYVYFPDNSCNVNNFACNCEGYICTNISPSATFEKP